MSIQKIRAFTLMELMIGLVVSSIAISSGYMLYQFTLKQYNDYKKVRTELVEFASFYSELENNFYHSEKIYFKDNKLQFDGGIINNIKYEFSESYVLRISNNSVDTFKVECSRFNAAKVNSHSNNLVSDVSFVVKFREEYYDVDLNKRYSAKEIIETEIDL